MPNSKVNWSNGGATDKTRTLTGENERTKNRKNELVKPDKQVTDWAKTLLFASISVLKNRLSDIYFNVNVNAHILSEWVRKRGGLSSSFTQVNPSLVKTN